MKNKVLTFLLCVSILLAAAPAVWAAAEDSGFYDIGAAEGVVITPVSASGNAVSGVSRDVDADGSEEVFYPASRELEVTLTDTERDELYLMTVSSAQKTLYADQKTGGGRLSFRAAFVLPDSASELAVEIGSTKSGFEKITVPLFYTASASAHEPSSTPGSGTVPAPAPAPPSPPVPAPEPGQGLTSGYASCARDGSCPMAAFTDISAAEWYHDGVHYALENGIMNGMGNGLFSPSSPASRAMIVTMLWRLEGMPQTQNAPFRDVLPDAWYAGAVNWAASEHIVDGYGPERFRPDDNITREQLAVILWRYAKYKGEDRLVGKDVKLGVFIDAEHISDWAYDGMQWAVDAGLISGVGNERLSPKTDAVRAQVATILMRYSRLS